jgi:RNA polymerase sigma-70 factor (ECF subfamily)
LTRQYAGLIYALARRMCLSQAEVEDAVQDVFIALWQSAARYNPAIAGEDTFIAMVARRRLIDRRRKSIRRSGELATEDFSYMPDDDASAPHTDRAALSEDARLAAELLGTLRPEQQRVIRLAIGQGFSHEQIADQTGLPLGTVKTHVRRGLIALREAMLKRRRGTDSGPDANPNHRQAEDDSGDGDD